MTTTLGWEVRQSVAEATSSALPDDWTTYPGPPESVAFPAAVIVPGTPYLAPATMCDGVYRLGVNLLLPRSQGVNVLEQLDELSDLVRVALRNLGGVVWESTDMGPMIAPGGVEAYGSTVNILLYP